jgi:hypothetical protein
VSPAAGRPTGLKKILRAFVPSRQRILILIVIPLAPFKGGNILLTPSDALFSFYIKLNFSIFFIKQFLNPIED